MNQRSSGEKLLTLALFVIIILGLVPRAVEVLSGNYLFGYDQGLFFEKVRRIVVEKKLTLIGEEVGGRGGFFQGPGFYYLLAIPFALSGGNPYSAMVLMFLVGVATMILVGYTSFRIFGAGPAVIITFLVAVSPAMVAQSRFIWNPFFVPIIYSGILFSFYKVIAKNNHYFKRAKTTTVRSWMKRLQFVRSTLKAKQKTASVSSSVFYYPLMMFLIGLLFHFEIATGIMVFGEFMVFSAVLFWRKYLTVKRFIIGIGAFLLTQANFILFDLRHDFLMAKGVVSTALGDAPHAITRTYVEHMFANHLDVFRRGFFSAFPYGGKLWPIILLVLTAGLVVLYRSRSVKKEVKVFTSFLVASPFLLFLLFMRYLWPMWEWWILELILTYCVLLGIALFALWKHNLWTRLAVAVLLSVFLISHISDTYQFYTVDWQDYGGVHKIRGKLDAIDVIYQDAQRAPFGLMIFTPPTYTYAYDYLLWWYGKGKYGYLPPKEKRELYYLLIEPDPQKPWTYQGWLTTVIKDGEVLKRWELPSGFIIEKRKGGQGET